MTGELGEKVNMNFQGPKWLAAAVEEAANRRLMSKSAWIREALIEHLGSGFTMPQDRTEVRPDDAPVGQENETP